MDPQARRITPEVLNAQLQKFSALISDPSSKLSDMYLTPYLQKLCYFANLLNLQFAAEVKFDRSLCIQCSGAIENRAVQFQLKLDCGKHVFCKAECAKDYVALYTENQILYWNLLKCLPCQFPVSKKFLENLYGAAEFKNMLEKASKDREKKFTCDICMGEFPVSDGITLNCDHRFCGDCIKGYLEAKINEAQVGDEDLSCPQGDNQLIEPNIIQYTVSPDIYEKYLKFAFNRWKPELGDDEIYFECHGVDCTNRIILPVTQQEYKCTLCGFASCPRCGDVVHKGSSCEAFKQWKEENDQADAKFLELMKKSQWIQCPWCNQAIERTSGCKYMSCFSSECRGKKYFCFDCKQGLARDHAPHNCVPAG